MSIVLSLIVKNESRNIERLLHNFCIIEGIKDVLIVDTGSTDDTVKLTRQFYKSNSVNGITIQHVFYNKETDKTCECHPDSLSKKFKKFHFGENRSFAIDMCYKMKPQCSFILMPDADSYFGLLGGANVDRSVGLEQYVQKYGKDHKRFYIFLAVGSNFWFRPILFSNDNTWKYNGILHEYLTSKGVNMNWTPVYNADRILPAPDKILSGDGEKFYMQSHRDGGGGGRNDEVNVPLRDAEFFEELLDEMKPDEEDYWRYVYYCSQSWYEAKNFDKFDHWAEIIFEDPTKHWIEEVYCTYIRWIKSYLFKERPRNKLRVTVNKEDELNHFIEMCDRGIKLIPNRAELYYFKAKKFLDLKMNIEAIKALEPAIDLKPYPTAHLTESYTYDGCREMYYKLKQLKVGLVVTSPATEIEILNSGYADFLTKNCQSVQIFNFNNSFTGLLNFPHVDIGIPSEISTKAEIDELVFVETIVDLGFSRDCGVPKVFLSLGKTKKVYSDTNFNIVWTQEPRLLQFLRSRGFNMFRVYGESSKTIQLSTDSVPTQETNLCFTGKRNLNPNLLQYEMLLVPHSQQDPKRDYYTNSLAWNIFPLQRKVLNKFNNDPVSFFIHAEKSMNDNSSNLEEIHEMMSVKFNNLSPEFYLTESIDNLIAIRFIKDLYVKQIVNNPVQPNYELFQRPLLEDGTVDKEAAIINAKNKKIMMVMTTCRRYHLFHQTMISILRKFPRHELNMVHTFLIVDDGSSEDDLKKMRDNFGSLFEIVSNSDVPGTSKGHPYSMNYIRDRVIRENFDYVVHLEDDWIFLDSKNYISECLDIMEYDPKVNQVMFNRNYHLRGSDELMYMNDFNRDVKRVTARSSRYYHHMYNSSGTWLERAVHNQYDPEVLHDPIDPMRRTESWPGFSFHPSMYSVAKTIALIGPYVTHKEFERCYSTEMYWNTPYTTAFLDDFSVYHKGKIPGFDEPDQKQNAYDLNPEARPGAKILVVANLKHNEKFRQFKETHKDVIYDVCWIDDYSTLNHGVFTNPQQVIDYRESLLKNLPMYNEIIRCDDPVAIPNFEGLSFSFKMDIAGYDIGRFDNTHFQMTITQMHELTLKLGGNAFNTLGYVKKIPLDLLQKIQMYPMPFFRSVSEGVYVLKQD
jgi:tetratricopeptide (TPR) repeat protein